MEESEMRVLANGLSAVSGGALAYLRNLLPRLYGRFAAGGDTLRVLIHESQRSQLSGFPDEGAAQ